jgi:SAM-dependent methyltransferase
MESDNIQKIQEEQYEFPYHHLVNFDHFDNHKTLYGGINYYGYIKKVLDYINKGKFVSLLDVGCGDGKLIFELARKSKNKKLTGIDFSEKAVLFAKAFNHGNGSEFIHGDVNELKKTYDVVTAVETLEHIPDDLINGIVDSIYRILPVGGRFVVSVPSTNDPLNGKHYRHYTLPSLVKTLEKFRLEEYSFVISNNKFYVFWAKLSGKLSNFGFVRKIVFSVSKSFFWDANDKTGTHIVAIFRKI